MSASPGSVSFDDIAAAYDRTRGGIERGEDFAEALAPVVVGPRVLDLGAGTGVVARGLRACLGCAVVGVDLSPAMLAHARERLGSVVAVGDAQRLAVRAGAVDTVLCVWLLQLVSDPAAVLAECARVVRPGGRVVVVLSKPVLDQRDDVHDALATIVDLRALMGRPRFDVPGDLLPLLADAGLEVVAEGRTAARPISVTPAEAIAQIEHREYGALAVLDAATYRRITDPVLQRLRSLAAPEEPRCGAVGYRWVALAPTGP